MEKMIWVVANKATQPHIGMAFYGGSSASPVTKSAEHSYPGIPLPHNDSATSGLSEGRPVWAAVSRRDSAQQSAAPSSSSVAKVPPATAPAPSGLFPPMPDDKKRKFVLVEDNVRGSRLRVRVTLEGVNSAEIPDSFRKSASVFPRSFFPREMESPPPSPTGSRFFRDDIDDDDDGLAETEGRAPRIRSGRSGSAGLSPIRGNPSRRRMLTSTIRAPVTGDADFDVEIPRRTRSERGKEVRLNELSYRMSWLQSRVFSTRVVFLQRASE